MVIYKQYWLVNVALTAALAVVSARTVAGTIERGLAVPVMTTAPGARAGADAQVPPAPIRPGVIVERNLFNSKSPGGVPEVPAAGRAANAPAPAPLPPLNARLIGTVLTGSGGFAVIEDGATRRQDLYRLNEVVLREAKLVAIERDRVRLRRGGKTEVLELAYVDRGSGPILPPVAAPPAQAPAPGGVGDTGGNRFVVDQGELNNAFENMNQLLTQARMVPFFSAGKADGFRIFAIRPNSLFEKIGLRDGDVLQRINGNELTDPARAFELFEQLRNEKQIAVDLVRNGAKQTLSYEIR